MKKIKIGLLPLYLKLYDELVPEARIKFSEFDNIISKEFEKREIEVVNPGICCVEDEFNTAVALFEKEKVDAIVTLHLAYSPSLESSKVLANTKIPIVVLDTTYDFSFSPVNVNDELIMMNHGIHGVQDMCNLLLRNNKPFQIEAGHWKKSNVIQRVISDVRTAKMASFMKNVRVGIIGKQFKGMGDFQIPFDKLKENIGIEVVQATPEAVSKLINELSDDEIENEIIADKKTYNCRKIDEDIFKQNIKTALAVRKWIQKENLSGFSMNFNEVNSKTNFPTMPFLEASKSMMRGIGYAGEGDVLTAALTSALLSEFSETSFVEIFCPGWEDDIIFLSHMGEMNLNLTQLQPVLIEKSLPFIDGCNPVIGVGTFKEGNAVLVNLAPSAGDKYKLIIAPVKVFNPDVNDEKSDSIRGWIKPQIPITDFLEEYSMNGGTHHSAMVYTNEIEKIEKFGKSMNFEVVKI